MLKKSRQTVNSSSFNQEYQKKNSIKLVSKYNNIKILC